MNLLGKVSNKVRRSIVRSKSRLRSKSAPISKRQKNIAPENEQNEQNEQNEHDCPGRFRFASKSKSAPIFELLGGVLGKKENAEESKRNFMLDTSTIPIRKGEGEVIVIMRKGKSKRKGSQTRRWGSAADLNHESAQGIEMTKLKVDKGITEQEGKTNETGKGECEDCPQPVSDLYLRTEYMNLQQREQSSYHRIDFLEERLQYLMPLARLKWVTIHKVPKCKWLDWDDTQAYPIYEIGRVALPDGDETEIYLDSLAESDSLALLVKANYIQENGIQSFEKAAKEKFPYFGPSLLTNTVI
eukprot:Nk52_evm52s1737 gene=Nk52_evmTU52s1737